MVLQGLRGSIVYGHIPITECGVLSESTLRTAWDEGCMRYLHTVAVHVITRIFTYHSALRIMWDARAYYRHEKVWRNAYSGKSPGSNPLSRIIIAYFRDYL